jgi:hypothetical protein
MSSKKALHTIPVPSTSLAAEAYLDEKGSSPTIRFSYFNDGAKRDGGLKFERACATRTRAERCCTAWHIDGAYDTLVEIEDSPWVDEVRSDMNPQWRDKWEMHHYMIYLDSAGCFEIIAASWSAL